MVSRLPERPSWRALVCSCLTSQSHTYLAQSLLQLERALRMGTSKLWELLSKDFARTGALLTTETTHLYHQMDRSSASGKIMERAAVPAVYPWRDGPAIGTGCGWRRGTEGECDLVSNGDVQELHVLIE